MSSPKEMANRVFTATRQQTPEQFNKYLLSEGVPSGIQCRVESALVLTPDFLSNFALHMVLQTRKVNTEPPAETQLEYFKRILGIATPEPLLRIEDKTLPLLDEEGDVAENELSLANLKALSIKHPLIAVVMYREVGGRILLPELYTIRSLRLSIGLLQIQDSIENLMVGNN